MTILTCGLSWVSRYITDSTKTLSQHLTLSTFRK